MKNLLILSLKCKKLKLILLILFLLSFCFTKSQKETLTISIPKNIKTLLWLIFIKGPYTSFPSCRALRIIGTPTTQKHQNLAAYPLLLIILARK